MIRIGYPCINTQIGCTSNSTFRLSNYSQNKLYSTIKKNLKCLDEILRWNIRNNIYFFRIGSQLVPFASHPVNKALWGKKFEKEFKDIGRFIKNNNIRISMHPDQFTILNSLNEEVVNNSIKELVYHCQILDLMKLNQDAKVQIHVGGVYGDKDSAISRFIQEYNKLPTFIKKRLVIENDHRSFSLADCLQIQKQTHIPIVFDIFHHQIFNNGEDTNQALQQALLTWKKKDGPPMVDLSFQSKSKIKGSHSYHLNKKEYSKLIQKTKIYDYDLMLEIKNKEKSALQAIKILKEKKK